MTFFIRLLINVEYSGTYIVHCGCDDIFYTETTTIQIVYITCYLLVSNHHIKIFRWWVLGKIRPLIN